jgi:hypothetical protein
MILYDPIDPSDLGIPMELFLSVNRLCTHLVRSNCGKRRRKSQKPNDRVPRSAKEVLHVFQMLSADVNPRQIRVMSEVFGIICRMHVYLSH